MERNSNRRIVALALGALERRSQLGERVYSILRGEKGLSKTQAGVVMSVAVVGLVAGAAELSRLPQLVSFAAPVNAAASTASTVSSGPMVTIGRGKMQNVVYRVPAAGAMMGAHQTLLKAVAPVNATPAVVKGATKRAAKVHAVKVAKKKIAPTPIEPRVMVISGWSGEGARSYSQNLRRVAQDRPAPRMMMTVLEDRKTGAEYTAIRTIDGWVVFPL